MACQAGEEISRVLPNSRFEILHGAGHNYFIAAGPKANQLAIDFLNEVELGLQAQKASAAAKAGGGC